MERDTENNLFEPLTESLSSDELESDLEATVTTDLDDYAPGSTAIISGSNFQLGETIKLQVLHNDVTPNTGEGHEPWFVIDGGLGDLDGLVDGNFQTTWYVNPDDSLNSSFDLTAIGLNSGIFASNTFTDSNPDPVQTFYIPLPEADIRTALRSLYSRTGSDINSVISITSTGDGSVIYYDHWEDGYENDISNPTQSTTEIWGDGNLTNGIAPGTSNDFLNAGDVIALENVVSVPRNSSQIKFDGRDKVASSKAIAISRAAWAESPGTVLAGAVEVYDTSKYGTSFEVPIGQNTSSGNSFEYTSLLVTASQDGTTINIDKNDGSGVITQTLNEGETYLVNGGINAGATVTSTDNNKPIQAHLITGDVGAYYESRWFTLYPTEQWSNSYYSPVGTTLSTDPAQVYVYNPNGSAITVNYETLSGTGSFSVPAGEAYRYQLPANSGAHFFTNNASDKFFAIGGIDSDNASNATHDWGFSLVPESNLTPALVIGWGPGSGEPNPTVNGSPVWVSATESTRIYVNYDGNSSTGNLTDPNGDKYDAHFDISKLESLRIFDPDRDQTAMRIYTVDGTNITAAWGQDPANAGPGNPYLDMGTTVLPFPISSAKKEVTLVNDTNNNTLVDLGDTIRYTITVTNDGVVPLENVVVSDIEPPGTIYVADSTLVDGQSFNDDTLAGATAFPVDDDGVSNGIDEGINIGTIAVGDSKTVSFEVTVSNSPGDIPAGGITNTARVDSDEDSLNITINTEVELPSSDPSTLEFTDASGTSIDNYQENATVYLKVTDDNPNTDPGNQDQVTVEVLNPTTGDRETITLTETGNNTGEFLGPIPSSSSSGQDPEDGTLNAFAGDTLEASYTDPIFSSDTSTDTATITVPSKTKILYLSDGEGLDRIDPVEKPDATTTTSPELSTGGGGGASPTFTENTTGGNDYEIKSGQPWGQTFQYTSGSGSYTLDKLALSLRRESDASSQTLTASLRDSWDGTVIASTDIATSSLSTDFTDIEFDLTNQTLTDGTTYYIRVDSDSSNGKIFWEGSSSSTYSDGEQINKDGDPQTKDMVFSVIGSTTTLTAIADTRLSPEEPTENYGATTLLDYRPADGDDEGSRTLFQFDLSSIPSGATITTASLSFYVENNKPWTVHVGRLTQPWVEGTGDGTAGVGADWEDYDSTNSWTNPGGDFAITGPTAETGLTVLLDDEDDSFQDGEITSLVQDWHNGTFPNYGLILYATTFQSGADVQIHSRDNTNPPVLAVTYELGAATAATTFTQSLPMTSNFEMPAGGQIDVVTHINVTSGTMPVTPAVTAVLKEGGTTFATLTNPTYDSGAGTLTWTGTVASTTTAAAGEAIELEITTAEAAASFEIQYDSSTYPSRIELPTTTVIDVTSFDIYNDSFANGGGNQVTAGANGETVYLRAVVSDPFGDTDIRNLDVTINLPDNTTTNLTLTDADVVDTDPNDGIKTYEYQWDTGVPQGDYQISVTANEGLETDADAVSDTAGTIFNLSFTDLGTPSITKFVDVNGDDVDIYTTTDEIYLQVTDIDKAGTGSVQATITTSTGDTENITLTETVAGTGVFTSSALNNTATNTSGDNQLNAPDGTVLSASYTDANDSTDISTDSASVADNPNNPPTAQDDSFSVNADSTLSDNVITNTNPNGADSDPETTPTLVAVNGSTDKIGTINPITLPSGALLTLNSNDGSYTYDPNGQFANLGVGQTATDTFEYTISDGNGGVDTAIVTITINGVNTAPTADNDGFTTSQGEAINLSAAALTGNDEDPNGDALSIDGSTFIGATANGSVTLNSGVLTYTPNPGFLGTDTFNYTINDGNGGTSTASIDITVSPFTTAATAGAIEGTVYEDGGNGDFGVDDIPLAGVQVNLYADSDNNGQPDGQIWATTYTDAQGNYSFTGLTPGNYVVEETLPTGATALNDADGIGSNQIFQVAATVTAGNTTTGRDFLVDSANTASINGTVYDDTTNSGVIDAPGDTGVAGVALLLYTDPDGNGDPSDGTIIGTTLTDSNGNYSFDNLIDGDYVVVEVDPSGANSVTDSEGDTTSPDYNRIAVNLSGGADANNQNFLNENTNLSSISGRVINDANANSIDDTESGINNVTVQLFSDPNGDGNPEDGQLLATATTSGDGDYSFDNLADGNYIVVETDPDGFGSTGDVEGSNDNQIAVSVSDANVTDQDFLDTDSNNLKSISGQVLEDNDTSNDDTLGGDDAGVGGVTVELYADNNGDGLVDSGDTLIDSTTTASDGSYQFDNLVDGNYVVQETDPAGATSETDTQGVPTDNNIGVTLAGANSTDNSFLDEGIILGTDSSENLTGTSSDNFIIGNKGQDTLSGGDGNDEYFFNETSDGVDIITDFNLSGNDKIVLTQILATELSDYMGNDPITDGYLVLTEINHPTEGASTFVQIDFDAGDESAPGDLFHKDIAFLPGVSASSLSLANDFLL